MQATLHGRSNTSGGAVSRPEGERSGSQWVNRFRGSASLDELRGSFKDKAEAFVGALRAAGATVTISATYRPPRRAYLMHWSWRIVKRDFDPAAVPPMDGVDINWKHDDNEGKYSRQLSIAAAKAMVDAFDIQRLGVAPALQSRHILGCGVDMNVAWTGALVIPDAYGYVVEIKTLPRSGRNPQLHRVAASYGVIKYNRAGRDDPHWSDNGA